MDVIAGVRRLLRDVLALGSRAEALTPESRLMGAIPEFDSMAVVSLVAAIEEEFGVTFDDSELTADVFSTLGSLAEQVQSMIDRQG
jgi:acyl carrier protein